MKVKLMSLNVVAIAVSITLLILTTNCSGAACRGKLNGPPDLSRKPRAM